MVDGRTKSLYLHSPASIEEKLRPNLKKSIEGMVFLYDITLFVEFFSLAVCKMG